MFEIYYVNGEPYEVSPDMLDQFLADNPGATKTPPETKTVEPPMIGSTPAFDSFQAKVLKYSPDFLLSERDKKIKQQYENYETERINTEDYLNDKNNFTAFLQNDFFQNTDYNYAAVDLKQDVGDVRKDLFNQLGVGGFFGKDTRTEYLNLKNSDIRQIFNDEFNRKVLNQKYIESKESIDLGTSVLVDQNKSIETVRSNYINLDISSMPNKTEQELAKINMQIVGFDPEEISDEIIARRDSLISELNKPQLVYISNTGNAVYSTPSTFKTFYDPITGVNSSVKTETSLDVTTQTQQYLEEFSTTKDKLGNLYDNNILEGIGYKKEGEKTFDIKVGNEAFSGILRNNGYIDKFGVYKDVPLSLMARFAHLFDDKGIGSSKKFMAENQIEVVDNEEFKTADDFADYLLVYQEQGRDLAAKRAALKHVYLLNKDIKSISKNPVQRHFEAASEGLIGPLATESNFGYSNRKILDQIQEITSEEDIPLSDEQAEYFERSIGEEINEGIGGSYGILASIYGLNKVQGVTLGVTRLGGYMAGLNAPRYVKNGKIFSQKSLVSQGKNLDDYTKIGASRLNQLQGLGILATLEEVKLQSIGFDPGVGAGFVLGTKALPFKFNTKYNQLNTYLNLQFKGAPAFVLGTNFGEVTKGVVDDIAGEDEISGFLQEHYGDLSKVGRKAIVDLAVGTFFAATHLKSQDLKRTQDIVALKTDASVKLTEAIVKYEESGRKDSKAKEDIYKYQEVYSAAKNRLDAMDKIQMYSDPKTAKKAYERQLSPVIKAFNKKGKKLSVEIVETLPEGKNAEYIPMQNGKPGIIRINIKKAKPGLAPHEVVHATFDLLFEGNTALKAKYLQSLKNIAKKIKIDDAGKISLYDRILEEKSIKDINKVEELFAYTTEYLAKTEYYTKLISQNAFTDIKNSIVNFAERQGINKPELKTQQQLLNFLGRYTETIQKGYNPVKQLERFQELLELPEIEIKRDKSSFNSIDLKAQQKKLIEANKKLAQTKPENYRQLAEINNKKLQDIRKNLEIADRNTKNIEVLVNREPTDARARIAKNKLIEDNAGVIENFFKSEFRKGLDVTEADFRSSMYETVSKIIDRYVKTGDKNVPFGFYLKQSLGGKHTNFGFSQLGNILKRAQEGRTTEVAFAELGGDFNIETLVDQSSIGGVAGLKTVEAGGSIGKRVIETLKLEKLEESIKKEVIDSEINLDGYVYKDIKSETAGVQLVKGKGDKLRRPTKTQDVVPTGALVKVLDIIAKEFGIQDVNRVLADKDLTTKMRNSARDFIYKNKEALQESIPEAETASGVATGIYNTSLKPMFAEVKARGLVSEGRTAAGKAVVRKKENFLQADFLALFGIKPDGTFLPGTKYDGAIRELIKQTAVITTNQSIREVYPGKYQELGVGRAEGLASLELNAYKEAFPEKTAEDAKSFFYNAYIGNTKEMSNSEVSWLKNLKTDVTFSRQEALLYGYTASEAMAQKATGTNFNKELQKSDIENVFLKNGEIITPEEIKGLDLSANFLIQGNDVIVKADRTNRFTKHSEVFSELLSPEFKKNITSLKQYTFLHQRTTFEGETRTQKIKKKTGAVGKITDQQGKSIVNQPFTNSGQRVVENVGKQVLKEVWQKDGKNINIDFVKADSQVTGQKKYREAKNAYEELAVIEKYFSDVTRKNKDFVFDGIMKTAEHYIFDYKNPTKKQTLDRMEWFLNGMKNNSQLRLGLRQNTSVIAVFKGEKPMTDGAFKLEHAKVSVRNSEQSANLVVQRKWSESGPDVLKDYVGVLGPKKLFDIVDTKGGKTNFAGLYRMALLEPKYLKQFVTVESKGKQTLLDYVLKTAKKELLPKEIQQAKQQTSILKEAKQKLKNLKLLSDKDIGLSLASKNLKIIDKATELGRKKNKNPQGISTFDFDETLIVDGKNFVTATKGKESIKISSEKFPIDGPKLQQQGYKFDFKDFATVRGGKDGPLLQKMRNQIKKFGPENVYVLTARMQEAAPSIQAWLKTKGIDIKIENITGLGNSTGEAKAMWMLEKASEGYNDFYFVDDALPNVRAVKDVLSQLDVKSKVQQALSSIDLNVDINNIMQHSLGISSQKTFSKAEAKVRGKDIKRRRIFMRDSAADLELLVEPLYGKGKKGNENKKWFKENLIMPFERGIRDYNTARQSAKNDYMSLRKQNKDVVKQISKEVEGTSFTNDMAMRVYLWNKAGFKIPDLAKTTEAKLVEHIKNNPKLQAYAEKFGQITKQEKGLKEPGENWWAETMAGEVTNIDRGVSRKRYLQEWIDRKNEIFTEPNLNKMESKLGTRWRENITDMFDRMETGRTRSLKLDRGSSAMMNYLNGGIGTIMNFNTRSAALQTISTLNFLNMRENNPISAALAMGNVKQFSKDFMFIMNSDMLKQRRDGLSINVTEAEIASAAASSKNMIQGIISKVLKVGYTPTKLADSFAISFGGATFYRNRIKMYKNQGMKTKEAEKQAFLDFQVLSERTQQSSRADLLSKQQTSLIGRIILPFANTPMQMNRAGMKDILDLAKGRTTGLKNQSEAVGRIAYYMGAQVAIFAGLQSALFAMLLNDEDVTEDKIASTKTYMLQSTSDSMLRGFGVQGAFISAFKNATLEFLKQQERGFKADYGEVAEDLLNLSPPIGSKLGMLDAAGDKLKRGRDVPFKFELGNQKLEAGLMSIQAVSNAPVYSPYQNFTNLQHSLSDQYETWQRVLMAAGWTPYNVGIEDPKKTKKRKLKTKSVSIDMFE